MYKTLIDACMQRYDSNDLFSVINLYISFLNHICSFGPGNLKLIAEYFQNSESLGGPMRDWIGIYDECST